MVQVVGSYLGYTLLRSINARRLLPSRWVMLVVKRERLLMSSFALLWRHSVELDGMYRLHIDKVWNGTYELYWRHHSGEETPAEVFPSLWRALVAAAPQVERYLNFSRSQEWTAA